jgi:hypothetical protein
MNESHETNKENNYKNDVEEKPSKYDVYAEDLNKYKSELLEQGEELKDKIMDETEEIQKSLGSVMTNATDSVREFSFNDFMSSTSLITNISFLLLVIFVFVILFQFFLTIIINIMNNHNNSPKLTDGLVPGNQLLIIQQDPSVPGAITIPRSNNAENGIEFTWSVWVFIRSITLGKYEHIFHKGDANINTTTGLNFPNNAPGLYITDNTNSFTIIMNTYEDINEEIIIGDIPLNKWVNTIIRCRNKTIDVYINGTIAQSTELLGVPKQNYGNVYIGMNGGFNGDVSNLWYYNHALNITEIDRLVSKGPNIKPASNSPNINNKISNYLSFRWFFNQ